MARCKVVPDHQSQTREVQPQNIQPQLHMPESRDRQGLWSFFWERERFGERKPVLSKKMGFLSPKKAEINNGAAVGLEYPVLDYPIFL